MSYSQPASKTHKEEGFIFNFIFPLTLTLSLSQMTSRHLEGSTVTVVSMTAQAPPPVLVPVGSFPSRLLEVNIRRLMVLVVTHTLTGHHIKTHNNIIRECFYMVVCVCLVCFGAFAHAHPWAGLFSGKNVRPSQKVVGSIPKVCSLTCKCLCARDINSFSTPIGQSHGLYLRLCLLKHKASLGT